MKNCRCILALDSEFLTAHLYLRFSIKDRSFLRYLTPTAAHTYFIATSLFNSDVAIKYVCKIVILSSIVDIIRILLVKLVKLFSMFSHIICYRMDFWRIKVFIKKIKAI